MVVNQKVLQNSPEKFRKSFYDQAMRLTGFDEKRCREILIGVFGETFEVNRVNEYLELLKEHAEDERSKLALEAHREKLRMMLAQDIKPVPCPVCQVGMVMKDRNWTWVCSEGGVRHRLADLAARAIGITPAEMLARIEALDEAPTKTTTEEA